MDISFDEKIKNQAGCTAIDSLCDKAKKSVMAEKTVIISVIGDDDDRDAIIAGNALDVTGELGELIMIHLNRIKKQSGRALANMHLDALLKGIQQQWLQG